MDIRCPCCHVAFALEQVVEDEALRELMGIITDLPREVSRPLVSYIGLFRGKSRATAYERQLRLAREVLAMHTDTLLVGVALSETVEAIRVKRESGEDSRPLRNHNYLKRVVESQQARGTGAVQVVPSPARPAAHGPVSKTAAALAALSGRARG